MRHFESSRASEITKRIGENGWKVSGIGEILYVVVRTSKDKKDKPIYVTDYLTSKAICVGMDAADEVNRTFIFMEPSDIIYRLKSRLKVRYGEDEVQDVPMEMLYNAMTNVKNGLSFLGHENARSIEGRAKERRSY